MIDIAWLKTHPDLAKESQRKRGESEELVDQILASDVQRREAINSADTLRAEHKKITKQIPGSSPEKKAELLAQATQYAEQVKKLSEVEHEAEKVYHELSVQISNIIDEQAPVGGEENFAVLKTVGETSGHPAPSGGDHADIAHALGMLDSERGAKVGGARFYFLKGYGTLLESAIIQCGLRLAVQNGFIPVTPPVLVKPEIMQGTGFLGQHADEVYHLERDDLYLVGTSEVPLAGMHSNEIINLDSGPLRYAGISTCFRREAGSYGKDTRGIIRVHQFNKLEMFSYCYPEDARGEHEKFLAWEEQMMAAIEVPYRVIDVASGDLGSSAARKFDCEAWMPSQQAYRELTSTSNCTTYQARRLGIRYKTKAKPEYVATVNGTLATTRWLAAIIENHYQPDGSVRVPQALIPFVGTEIIAPPAHAIQ